MKSIFAGVMISLGCYIYLRVGGPLGAFMFSLGLMSVILFGYTLFTGRAHMLRTNEILGQELALVWVGNLVGCFLAACVAYWLHDQVVIEGARAIVESRVAAGPFKVFIMGIPTGLLMTVAVRCPKEEPLRLVFVAMCVGMFILCGFAHCVADMFYFWMGSRNWTDMLYILPVTLGNLIGCQIFVKKTC